MPTEGKSTILIVLLVLAVVGSLAAVSAERPTEVYMTLSLTGDFQITFNPTSSTVKPGDSFTVKVNLRSIRFGTLEFIGDGVEKYGSLDATLSLSHTIGSYGSVALSKTQVHLSNSASPPTGSVDMQINLNPPIPVGTYSITVKASVKYASYPNETPKVYQSTFALGVSVPPVDTTTSGQLSWTKTKVGETYGQITVHYKNGQSRIVKSSQLVQLSLPTSEQVGTYDFDALTMTILPEKWPCVIYNYPPSRAGEQQCADDLLLGVDIWGEIRIDGVVVFKKDTIHEFFYAKDPNHFFGIIGGVKFKIGDPVHASWNLKGFDPQPYFKKAYDAGKTSVTVELQYWQHWSLAAYWLVPWGFVLPGVPNIPGIPSPGIAYEIGRQDVDVLSKDTQPVLPPGAEADFGLMVSPISIEVGTESNSWKDIQVTTMNINSDKHFESQITFSVSGLPSGVTGVFSRASDRPNSENGWIASSVLRVQCSSSATLGTYDFQVTGTGGGKTHSKTVSLTIVESAEPPPNLMQVSTTIDVSFVHSAVKPGSEATLQGKLVDENNRGLSGKSLIVSSTKFDLSEKVETGSGGKFEMTFDAPEEEGTYTIKVSFAGDSTYSKTSENLVLTVSSEAAGDGDSCGDFWADPLSWITCWLKGSTCLSRGLLGICLFAIPNWAIAIIAVIVLYLLLRRSSGLTVVTGDR